MKQYLDLVKHVLENGELRSDRTGVGTISMFGLRAEYDLRKGFPLVTTKRVNFSAVVKELLWFLRGETNINTLGCGLWSEWADATGECGPIYGAQYRSWGGRGIDQVSDVIAQIKANPQSRRHIVSAWNVEDLPSMALPPCHLLYQFYVTSDGHLDCQLYQRSADLALGVPFNIASYALLTHMIANECELTPGRFVHVIGDAHVYANHVDGLREQLSRQPRKLPTIKLANKPVLEMTYDDITLCDYEPDAPIKFKVAV